jgi:hypothetical protein
MKFNQWTLGLAAVGLVSLASAARADETNTVLTALSSTTLSGYVDTSMQWNVGTGDSHAPGYGFGGASKADGFNLNVVDLNLEKDADASAAWGAGYRVELWMGPDANGLATSAANGDFAVKNAYVDLKAPLGNGLDIKVGTFDTIIGYEVADSINNPNFTRSWGFSMEPTTHTGVLASYTVNDMLSLSAGVANTYGPALTGRSTYPNPPALGGGLAANESYKTYMASATFTASTNWGWVGGSTFSAGVISGFNSGSPSSGPTIVGGPLNGNGITAHQTSLYAGGTLNTPIKELKTGFSVDYVFNNPISGAAHEQDFSTAESLYATYQLTEKLSVNGRAEYAAFSKATAISLDANGVPVAQRMISVTGTLQYDLWKNVLSRIEARWDHSLDGAAFGDTGVNKDGYSGTLHDSYELIGSLAYKF